MASVELEDLTIVIAVSIMHAFQIALNAKLVGKARHEFKISPPEMNGPPKFMRTLRVQQNDLEFALVFQVLLWSCGLCFHQVIAGVLGLVYIYARKKYAKGYIEAAEKRVSGFRLSTQVIKLMLGFCIAGLVTIWMKQLFNIDLAAVVRSKLSGKTEL